MSWKMCVFKESDSIPEETLRIELISGDDKVEEGVYDFSGDYDQICRKLKESRGFYKYNNEFEFEFKRIN